MSIELTKSDMNRENVGRNRRSVEHIFFIFAQYTIRRPNIGFFQYCIGLFQSVFISTIDVFILVLE